VIVTNKIVVTAPAADTQFAAVPISVQAGQRVRIVALIANYDNTAGANQPVSLIVSDGDDLPFRCGIGVVAAAEVVNVSAMLDGYFRGDVISGGEDGNAPLPDFWWSKNITVTVEALNAVTFQWGALALWYEFDDGRH